MPNLHFFSNQGVLSKYSNAFIPNDTVLGGSSVPVLLLRLAHGAFIIFKPWSCYFSGANMAGKSTLSRQVAVLTVLAQIVSFEWKIRDAHKLLINLDVLGLKSARVLDAPDASRSRVLSYWRKRLSRGW